MILSMVCGLQALGHMTVVLLSCNTKQRSTIYKPCSTEPREGSMRFGSMFLDVNYIINKPGPGIMEHVVKRVIEFVQPSWAGFHSLRYH